MSTTCNHDTPTGPCQRLVVRRGANCGVDHKQRQVAANASPAPTGGPQPAGTPTLFASRLPGTVKVPAPDFDGKPPIDDDERRTLTFMAGAEPMSANNLAEAAWSHPNAEWLRGQLDDLKARGLVTHDTQSPKPKWSITGNGWLAVGPTKPDALVAFPRPPKLNYGTPGGVTEQVARRDREHIAAVRGAWEQAGALDPTGRARADLVEECASWPAYRHRIDVIANPTESWRAEISDYRPDGTHTTSLTPAGKAIDAVDAALAARNDTPAAGIHRHVAVWSESGTLLLDTDDNGHLVSPRPPLPQAHADALAELDLCRSDLGTYNDSTSAQATGKQLAALAEIEDPTIDAELNARFPHPSSDPTRRWDVRVGVTEQHTNDGFPTRSVSTHFDTFAEAVRAANRTQTGINGDNLTATKPGEARVARVRAGFSSRGPIVYSDSYANIEHFGTHQRRHEFREPAKLPTTPTVNSTPTIKKKPTPPSPTDCAKCTSVKQNGGPSHDGYSTCRNGTSIAAGGTVAHCSCAGCF